MFKDFYILILMDKSMIKEEVINALESFIQKATETIWCFRC